MEIGQLTLQNIGRQYFLFNTKATQIVLRRTETKPKVIVKYTNLYRVLGGIFTF